MMEAYSADIKSFVGPEYGPFGSVSPTARLWAVRRPQRLANSQLHEIIEAYGQNVQVGTACGRCLRPSSVVICEEALGRCGMDMRWIPSDIPIFDPDCW